MFNDRVGKIGYMAPEIFAGERYDGCSADIYSCGVMLFILLTATPPYSIPHVGRDARFAYTMKIGKGINGKNEGMMENNTLAVLGQIYFAFDTKIGEKFVKHSEEYRHK